MRQRAVKLVVDAVGPGHLHLDVLARLDVRRRRVMVKVSVPSSPRLSAFSPSRELQRKHAHADQVRAVDALEALGDDRADAEQHGALGRPVARAAGAIFLAGEDDERRPVRCVGHRRVVDRHRLAGRRVAGEAALDIVEHAVADADVGEGAAHHHFVVAAARAVAVELGAADPVLEQIAAGRAVGLDRARPAKCGRW